MAEGNTEGSSIFEAERITLGEMEPVASELGLKETYSDFTLIAQEKGVFKKLPKNFEQPRAITEKMLATRGYTQKMGNEQATALYRQNETGDWYLPRRQVTGKFNPIDRVHESGMIPEVKDCSPVVHIHSHSGVTEEEEAHRLAADFHSEHDLGLLMLSSFLNPHFDSISMKIVAGKDLGVMICRTKQTPAKEKLTKSLKPSSFANVVNDALRIGREVEAGKFYPGKFTEKFRSISGFCEKYKLGMYLMRLREGPNTSGAWVRFFPLPKKMEQATDELLGRKP